MSEDCQQHSGQWNEDRRRPYDDIMGALPRNQAGDGLARHACAICAYEQGWKDAQEAIANRFGELIRDMPPPGVG